MQYIVANWKAHKNLNEATSWMETILSYCAENHEMRKKLDENKVRLIIAPPYPLLLALREKVGSKKNIAIAAQDVSSFAEGPVTGEVSAKSLQGLAEYAIVGHSARREHFKETDEIIAHKVNQLHSFGIAPIVCIRDRDDAIPAKAKLITYEPVWAIGTGHSQDVAEVLEVKKSLLISHNVPFLYGAGLSRQNIKEFLNVPDIDGFMIASASLDPQEFVKILNLV